MNAASMAENAKRVFATYAGDVRAVARDTLLPYRNFLHWSASKLAIFVYVTVAGFVFSIPFIGGMLLIVWRIISDPGEGTKAFFGKPDITSLARAVVENFWGLSIITVLFLVIVTIFSVFVTYGYFLLSDVHRSYLENRPLPLREIGFFDRKRLARFVSTIAWMSLYVALPLLAGAIAFALAVVLFQVS